MTDVDGIKIVINYDFPQQTEDYVHRIGRTGRSSHKGEAYTFFTENEQKLSKQLVDILVEAKQVSYSTIGIGKGHFCSNSYYFFCLIRK